jgi:multicomponent Na+:H+ antiporter subunit C
MTAAIAAGILVAAGVYLILQRGLVRIAIGFVLLGHAANVVLVAAGGMALRDAPLLGSGDRAQMADPLPQAFVLTAIVITFGITIYLLALARVGGDDDPDEDVLDPDLPDDLPEEWLSSPPDGRSGPR